MIYVNENDKTCNYSPVHYLEYQEQMRYQYAHLGPKLLLCHCWWIAKDLWQ